MLGFGRKQAARLSLEHQVEVLADCGIRLRPDRTIEDLLISCDREEYEAHPYERLIHTMGIEVEEPPHGRRYSDDICLFATECIEDAGEYAAIAERLAELASGDLPLSNVRDHLDHERGEAWLEVTLDGERRRYEAVVNDDWVDPGVFCWIASLLRQRGGEARFTMLDAGQDVLIGYATPAQRRRLNKQTGLHVEWLR